MQLVLVCACVDFCCVVLCNTNHSGTLSRNSPAISLGINPNYIFKEQGAAETLATILESDSSKLPVVFYFSARFDAKSGGNDEVLLENGGSGDGSAITYRAGHTIAFFACSNGQGSAGISIPLRSDQYGPGSPYLDVIAAISGKTFFLSVNDEVVSGNGLADPLDWSGIDKTGVLQNAGTTCGSSLLLPFTSGDVDMTAGIHAYIDTTISLPLSPLFKGKFEFDYV